MKKTFKQLGFIAMFMIIVFSFVSCEDSDDGETTNTNQFTSISEFDNWLIIQPDNTTYSPYFVKLNVGNISTLKATLNNSPNKYVSLDLSGSTLMSIPVEAFSWCTNIVSITIPYGVISIGSAAFNGCENLSSINIPQSVTSIGVDAFFACHSLASITIPNSVTSIGEGAFANCTSLNSIDIPNNVMVIEDSTFYNCTSITYVTIPNGVTSIGVLAFVRCSNLASITIPYSVNGIEVGAFDGCLSLVSVTFQGTIPSSEFISTTDYPAFPGDLRDKFYATDPDYGTPGTYTRTSSSSTWTRQ
jgi:hypothetical protein